MSANNHAITIRPLVLQDLDVIFMIDHKIRSTGKAITYEYLTTEHIFTIDRKVSRMKHPSSYVDLITGDVSELLEFGFVAALEDHVRGFILGRTRVVSGATAKVGEILILGVHPDYWQKGIATLLLDAISEKYRSKGIHSLHIEVDHRDKPLLNFCERAGFEVGHRVTYMKTI
jgi:ribosomal protein S18 acetylase RimI-like enzyme